MNVISVCQGLAATMLLDMLIDSDLGKLYRI